VPFFTRAVAACSLLLVVLLAQLTTSCATQLPPESEWNQVQLWQRVGDTPPTYIPKGYGATRPRTSQEGTWVADKRDGKRFFIPNRGVPGCEAGVLMGEARKLTGYRHASGMTPGEKAFAYPVWLLFRVAAPVPLPE
jgi:hypothetical protein